MTDASLLLALHFSHFFLVEDKAQDFRRANASRILLNVSLKKRAESKRGYITQSKETSMTADHSRNFRAYITTARRKLQRIANTNCGGNSLGIDASICWNFLLDRRARSNRFQVALAKLLNINPVTAVMGLSTFHPSLYISVEGMNERLKLLVSDIMDFLCWIVLRGGKMRTEFIDAKNSRKMFLYNNLNTTRFNFRLSLDRESARFK